MARSEILVNLMKTAQAELDQLAAVLSESERNAPGLPDRWSVKDVVGHLGTWQGRLVTEIDSVEGGGKLPEWGDLDAANLAIFNENAQKTWDEVWADMERCSQAAILRTSGVSDEVLSTQVEGGRSFERVIFGNTFIHWIDHIMGCYLERGDIAGAERLLQLELRELQAFDPSPRTQAIAKYNTACFYAKTRQPQKAVDLLREVFLMRPDLRDWAKQDGDLVNLHDSKEYEELFR